MPSHPLSARKTRDAARAAVTATNAQADALQRIAQQFDTQIEAVRDRLDAAEADVKSLSYSRDVHRSLWFDRDGGFFGRLKFLVLGRWWRRVNARPTPTAKSAWRGF